jgi:DNA-binding MarR family transcriptional regulator
MMDAYLQWFATGVEDAQSEDQDRTFHRYTQDIAQARYVARKVFRIVDEQARGVGVEPLHYQLLIQVYGAPTGVVHVTDVAERLDVAPAFASRLIKELQERGLVERAQSTVDKRMTQVSVTPDGIDLLRRVDAAVHLHLDYFQKQLNDDERLAALTMFAFSAGLAPESEVGAALRHGAGAGRYGQR